MATHCERCQLVIDEDHPEKVVPGTLIDDRYRVEAELGGGAIGTIVRARDVHLRRPVAIKILRAKDGAQKKDSQDEASALATVGHRGVVQVYAFGVHAGAPFFVMELVDGPNLFEVIKRHASQGELVPLHRALDILQRLMRGVAAVHAVGLVHRDIKPHNVVIETATGRPVLVDFGLARGPERPSADGIVVGTPLYLAPESACDGKFTTASDVYALGCVAFELLSGAPPFSGATLSELIWQHAHERPPLLAARDESLAPFDPVIQRALAKDAKTRFPSSVAFGFSLESAASAKSPLPENQRVEHGIQVLVVDDDPIFERLLTRCVQVGLADIPVAVRSATSGYAAVARAEVRMPDLVLLDYELPELNGIEVLSRIRAMPGGDRVHVMVVSGNASESERWRFSILGVTDFLAKPLSFTALVTAVLEIGLKRGWVPLGPSSIPVTL